MLEKSVDLMYVVNFLRLWILPANGLMLTVYTVTCITICILQMHIKLCFSHSF